MSTSPPIIAAIGGGNMGQAILHGAISAGVLDPTRIVVADPAAAARAAFESAGVATTSNATAAIEWLTEHESEPGSGQLLLGVKPQLFAEVAEELGPILPAGRRVVMSILAGMTSHRIQASLADGAATVSVVRIMPNTPARIRRGVSAIALGEGTNSDDATLARKIFEAVGVVVDIDESLMDAFTALGGSGPAYVFYLAEAMTAAAVRMGFDQETAGAIVSGTVAGAGALLVAGDQSASELRAAVTSRGGTTAAALDVLEQHNVFESVVDAVRAARARGAELAQS